MHENPLLAMPDWHRRNDTTSARPSRDAVQRWLDDYVAAWTSYDEAAIAELWAPDAVWHYPWGVRATSGAQITAEWMSERERYADDRFDAHYEPVAIDGDTVIAHGRTVFYDTAGEVDSAFDNIWLVRFDDEGRCVEFHEWYAGLPEDDPDRAIPISE